MFSHARRRRKKWSPNSAPIESLENRALLAGDVAARVVGGDLIIEGDRGANQIEVTVLDGDVIVQGMDGTTVNGVAEFTAFAGTNTIPDDLQIRMDEGSDDVVLDRGLVVTDHLDVHLAGGTNSLSLLDVSVGRMTARGDGANTVQILADAEVGGDVFISLREGADTVVVDQAGLGGRLTIWTGTGHNTTILDGVMLPGTFSFKGGADQDDVLVNASELGRVSLLGAQGPDFVQVDGTDVAGSASVNLGSGDDHLVLEGTNRVGGLTANGHHGMDALLRIGTNQLGGLRQHSIERTSIDNGLLADRRDGASGINTRRAAATAFLDQLINDGVLTLTIDPTAFSEGAGNAAAGRVETNKVLTRDLVVTLTSSDETAVTTLDTVTIPAGQMVALFDVTATDDNGPDDTQAATITASAERHASDSVDVEVTDDDTLSLSLAVSTLSEGDDATATLTRNSATHSDLVVTLTTSDDTELTVPATVTIPAGQASVDFTVTAADDAEVDGDQTVTLSASEAGHTSSTVSLTVTDDDLLTLTLSETDYSEGDSGAVATATVGRESATDDPLEVTINGDATELNLPATVTIPAGQSSVTFDVEVVDDTEADGTQTVPISVAATGHSGASIDVTVQDNDILSLSIDVTEFSEDTTGVAATGTVTRQSATDVALVVTLTSDDTEVSHDPTVTIPIGETSATFEIMAVDDTDADGTQTVTITASEAGHSPDSVDVSVTDNEVLTVSIDTDQFAEGAGGSAAMATVTRASGTTGDLVVNLTSDDTTELTVPAVVTIPDGQDSMDFTIAAVDDSEADGTQTVTITATATNHVAGTDTVDVTDDDILELTVTESTFSEGAGLAASVARVTRLSDPMDEIDIDLINTDSSELEIPSSVTILAGETFVEFNIDAVDDNIDDGTQVVTITASHPTHTGASVLINVTDTNDLSVVIPVSEVGEADGPNATFATVTRQGDTADPLTVNLASSDTSEITVPATIIISAGQSSAVFPLDAIDDALPDLTQEVTITASATGLADATARVDVLDDDAAVSLSFTPMDIAENGGTSTGTLMRDSDTTDPLVVTLSSTSDEVTFPETVSFLAGDDTATFTITAVDDDVSQGNRTVTVSAAAELHQTGTGDVMILDDDDALTITLDTAFFTESAGAAAATATITRDSDTTDPLTVTLSIDDTSEASVTATATIPAGQASVDVDIDAVNDTDVDGVQMTTISATAADHLGATESFIVNDDDSINITILDSTETVESNGTFITKNESLVIEGATAPNQEVLIDTDEDGDFDDGTVTADAAGLFSFTSALTNNTTNRGQNNIAFQTSEGQTTVETDFAIHLAVGSVIRFESSEGTWDTELLDADAPKTVANFKNYLERYTDSIIHRSPDVFVIQGGGFTVNGNVVSAITTDPSIDNEFDSDNSNVRGTLSMALGLLPSSGTSQWFFSTIDNSRLDDNLHTVFGRVIGDGMTIVDNIDDLPDFNVVNVTGQSALSQTPLSRSLPIPIDGTVSGNSGSTTVTGVGTSFQTDVQVGDFVLLDDTFSARVAQVQSDTQLQLSTSLASDLSGVDIDVQTPDADDYVVFSSIGEILDEI